MDLWDTLAQERRAIADRLDTLSPDQWQIKTLCPAWTVHEMVAHLVVPTDFTTGEMITALRQAHGRPEQAALIMVGRRSGLSSAELVARLRAQAGARQAPPIVGVMGPYTDALVHALDLWIPLGLPDDRPAERWLPALEFLFSRRSRVGFLPAPAPRLRYVPTDTGSIFGDGPEVRGPAAAIGLALTGRTSWLDRLQGPGVATLRSYAYR